MTPRISFGSTEVELPHGTHICQIFNDEDERSHALLQFLLSGLKAKELNACFSEKIDTERLQQLLVEHNLDLSLAKTHGDLVTAGSEEVYFQGGTFDPDLMLKMLADFHARAEQEGYSAVRVIGEMSPKIHTIPGGSQLFDYEARVNQLLKTHPVTTVCQYDAHAFDGGTIMDVVKVHPMMLIRGNVIHNPYYVPAQDLSS